MTRTRITGLLILAGAILAAPAGSLLAQSRPTSRDAQTAHEQHAGHGTHHKQATGVKLSAAETAPGRITLRMGPLALPANSDHMAVAQAPDFYWEVPFDGWLTAYHPRMVSDGGEAVPGRVLHHVAFWNTARSDFLCPNKEEHIFGAGGEMNDWPELPGFGYRVTKGERIRINTMFHNPTDDSFPRAYLEVVVEYHKAGEGAPRKSVYPAWFDVQRCGNSGYDLAPGKNVTFGDFTLKFTGTLLGLGGHMHDYGERLEVANETRNEPVAQLPAQLDSTGRILSMPIVTFFDRGGYRLNQGEKIRVTATYHNRTGQPLHDGAMGIAVGYFLPDDDAVMAALRREPKAKEKVAANQ